MSEKKSIFYPFIKFFGWKPIKALVEFLFLLYWRSLKKKKTEKPKCFWGPAPLVSFKYWSQVVKDMGYTSQTLVSRVYNINNKSDFDEVYEELLQKTYKGFPYFFKFLFKEFFIFDYALKHYSIFHFPASGGPLGNTNKWNKEAELIHRIGGKVIILPYGADFFQYSKVSNVSLRHALMSHYPRYAREEETIEQRIKYWSKEADVFLSGLQTYGLGRWDLFPYLMVTIDDEAWKMKATFSKNNGTNGVVNVIHTPNHRVIKGTEYVIRAIEELKKEGLQVNLILLEGVKNDEVKRIMQEDADILVEQLIQGYALSAIEGMSTGVAVISNLEEEHYTRAFRRYSYLEECPILNGTPEDIKDKLRMLITNPQLREDLGKAGRAYVEKYHSEESAKYMFSRIYDKIWFQKEVDLMNMYHPLNKKSYNNLTAKVKHPLINNEVPNDYWKKVNHKEHEDISNRS